MTETTNIIEAPTPLPDALEDFILQWGDMGGQWGVNRSVSQIHAFLYLQEAPVTAERIAAEFGMARSNVSNSLKELLAWDLIRRVPVKGDRRDHFRAETDVWEIAQRIAAGRKRRELDPAIATLRECADAADRDGRVGKVQRERLRAMLEFTEAADRWYGQMLALPKGKRDALLRLGSRIASLLPGR